MSVRRSVVAVTVVALLVRVATLDVQSFWSDEAATVTLLEKSFGDMLQGVVDGESTPPLYYLLAWVWTHVFGTGEVGVRLLSALVSAGTVPVVAALAARIARPADEARAGRAALFGAALAAISPLAVWYGQEARAYALLMLLVAGATLALLRALERPTHLRLALWAILAVAAIWTHHFALFAVVAQGLWALWSLRRRALAAVGVVALGAAALTPLLLHQREAGRASFIAQEPLLTRLAQIPKQVLAGYDAPAEVGLVVVGLVAVLVAATGWQALRRSRAGLVVASTAAVGVALPLLAALVGQDFVLTRNVIGGLPLVLAFVAAGAATATRPVAGRTAVAALCVTGTFCAVAVAADGIYQRDDFRAAIRAATPGPGVPRLVVADQEARVPSLQYLGRAGTRVALPGAPELVREIDVVRVAGARPGGARSTPVLPSAAVPAGFTLAGEDRGDTWAVRRYVAATPVAVDPGALRALDPARAIVVLARDR